jgi:hypothetical protein
MLSARKQVWQCGPHGRFAVEKGRTTMASDDATALWVRIVLLLLSSHSMGLCPLDEGVVCSTPMVPCDNTACSTGKTLPSTRTLHGAMQLQYSWPQGKRVGVKSRRRAKVKAAALQMIGTSVVVRGPPLVHCCPLLRPATGTAVDGFLLLSMERG